MSKIQSIDRKRSQQRPPAPKDFEEHMTWRIRWYLIIAITIAYTLSIIGGLFSFWVTRDTHYLLFIAPTALIPFVYYLVPMDKKRYYLKGTYAQTVFDLFREEHPPLKVWSPSYAADHESAYQVTPPSQATHEID